jgi:lysophospholipase
MSHFINREADVIKYPDCAYVRFYEQQVTTGFWQQANNMSTHYGYVVNSEAKAWVVLSPGRAEPIIKYAELIYELYQNGYSVFAIDHKGQGKSSRVLANSHVGYIDDFDEYVEDFKHLIDKVLDALLDEHSQNTLPKYLLCHSMGGTIGSLFVQKYPLVFNKMVLSTPMYGVKAPMPEYLLAAFLSVLIMLRRLFRLPITYLWGQSDYRAIAFYKNRLTHSEIRYRAFRAVMAQYPENQMGGISFEWLSKALKAVSRVRKNAKSVLLPCLIIIAEDEQIVDNRLLRKTAKLMPNTSLIDVPNARHEVFFEQDAARSFALSKIYEFLEA